jgi:hypothetical protein
MSKYCCFIEPQKDYSEKNLSDISPSGYPYGFPIFNPPTEIGEYKVIYPIDRGFYGVTYIVQDRLKQNKVLKVIPKIVYQVFGKNFENECILHANIASDSEHIVGINNIFDTLIEFPTVITIDCHVCILDFVKGETLRETLNKKESIEPLLIAQIAIDLFYLLNELSNKQVNHNDLHAGNLILKELDERNKRADEINNYYKIVAIDLGSLSEESKSDGERLGDIHRVSSYLRILSQKLLAFPDKANDNDYKLAYLLDEYARFMSSKIQNQTIIGFLDAIEDIKNACRKTYYPWKDPVEFKHISDSYNAQTLQPSYVPELLVDPDDKWSNKISSQGPLLITGMRGCGKTMFLKSLQFHTRAIPIVTNFTEKESDNQRNERLKNERYVGLYVSSRKLLDPLGKDANESIHDPFSRLFIAYTIEAIRTIRHLFDINREFVSPSYYIHLKDVISNILPNNDILKEIKTDISLENALIGIAMSLSRGESFYRIFVTPSDAFDFLAEAIKKCSIIWQNHYILFLLDDVSTRYFHIDNISNLLSSLIFQSEICAFKITSEAQTIELVLNSPGNIAKARHGRDFDSFDLGQEVYDKIKENNGRKGVSFIEEILAKRALISLNHPRDIKPSQLLGENTLINVARSICSISDNMELKNKIYYGMSTLAGLCVGDIGEIIKLYDSILKHYRGSYPIDPEKQSECFRDLSSERLYQLTRNNIDLKDYALSFAEAAHDLLIRSNNSSGKKLRQYYSMYIRITSGEKEEQDKQFNKILELIDAGIFVFAGGSISPRIASFDGTNPIKQFVLIYRKLYGITNLIGLQQADRFELNGERLIRYLENPKKGKEILMEGLGSDNEETKALKKPTYKSIKGETNRQTLGLFDTNKSDEIDLLNVKKTNQYLIDEKKPKVKMLTSSDITPVTFDLVILGLGFETRALTTIQELIDKNIVIKKVICIKYKEIGQSEGIINSLKYSNIDFDIVDYDKFITKNVSIETIGLNILICLSGLSKILIFKIINTFFSNNRLIFSHTLAQDYYPLDADIKKYLEAYRQSDFSYELLENMTSNLIKGEKGPYEVIQLHNSNADESKKRVLITFSSTKYERLFKILDEREYDIIELISPFSNNPRTELAENISVFLSKRFNHVIVKNLDTNNIKELIDHIYDKYYHYYVLNNCNVEFALTGSKRQTVICSIITTMMKISKCWYVSPTSWDTEKFSIGSLATEYFEITDKTDINDYIL